MNNQKTAISTIYFSIIGNISLALIKGIAGFFGNSYALIADAIESTTDIFSLGAIVASYNINKFVFIPKLLLSFDKLIKQSSLNVGFINEPQESLYTSGFSK
mgnify:CR=1 FL=1